MNNHNTVMSPAVYYLQSIKNNKYGILLMLFAAVLTATGQLCWKLSQGMFGWHLMAGFILYALGAVVMMGALRFGKLSVLHPLLCVSYVAGLVLSHLFLSEGISVYQYIGIAIVMSGVIVVSIGDH